jgi:hypothetical protein
VSRRNVPTVRKPLTVATFAENAGGAMHRTPPAGASARCLADYEIAVAALEMNFQDAAVSVADHGVLIFSRR